MFRCTGNKGAELPEPVLASIAAYYHRATTTSRPMSRLIVLVMLILLGALGFQAVRGHDPGWLLVTSAILAAVPMLLALVAHGALRGSPRTALRRSARTVRPRAGDLSGSPRLRWQHAGVPGPVGCAQRGDLMDLSRAAVDLSGHPEGPRTKLEHVSVRRQRS